MFAYAPTAWQNKYVQNSRCGVKDGLGFENLILEKGIGLRANRIKEVMREMDPRLYDIIEKAHQTSPSPNSRT